MIALLTTENIQFVIYLLTLLFVVYNTFKNPQIKAANEISLLEQSLEMLRADFVNLRDNHVHTLDVKQDQMMTRISSLENEVVKLCTIIEERIPKKY